MWLSLFLEGIAVFEELGKSWGLCPQTPGRWQPLRGADAALSLFGDSFKGQNLPFETAVCGHRCDKGYNDPIVYYRLSFY